MSTVFVTGASGFVGRHVVRTLESRGFVVSQMPGRRERRPQSPPTDLLDVSSYVDALAGTETVVHLAAQTARAKPQQYYRVNTNGTAAVLRAAENAAVRRFLLVSTIGVTFRDTSGYHYARSKAKAEDLVRASSIHSTIVRPTIVMGPGSGPAEMLLRLASLPIVPAFGGARALVQPIDVVDLAELIVDTLDPARPGGETLEFGGPQAIPLRDVLDLMHQSMRGTRTRFLNIPLAPLVRAWSLLERLMPGALPFTVGQLATFRFDGTARPNDIWERRRMQLTSLDDMVARCIQ